MEYTNFESRKKKENKIEDNANKAYEMIFKKLFQSHKQDIIKEQPEYDSILNDTLKLMDEIYL